MELIFKAFENDFLIAAMETTTPLPPPHLRRGNKSVHPACFLLIREGGINSHILRVLSSSEEGE